MSAKSIILVPSCQAYRDLWSLFAECLFRYWPDCPFPVFFVTDRGVVDHPKVSTIELGRDFDYSTNVLRALEATQADWALLWIEDRPLVAAVDDQLTATVIRQATDTGVGYLKMIPEYPVSYDQASLFGPVPTWARYRVSITVGLWQTRVLKAVLRSGENAWELERNGAARSAQRPEPFCGLSTSLRRRPPLPTTHLVMKGKWIRGVEGYLRKEGFASVLPGRPRQTLGAFLYLTGCRLHSELLMASRRHWREKNRLPTHAPAR